MRWPTATPPRSDAERRQRRIWRWAGSLQLVVAVASAILFVIDGHWLIGTVAAAFFLNGALHSVLARCGDWTAPRTETGELLPAGPRDRRALVGVFVAAAVGAVVAFVAARRGVPPQVLFAGSVVVPAVIVGSAYVYAKRGRPAPGQGEPEEA